MASDEAFLQAQIRDSDLKNSKAELKRSVGNVNKTMDVAAALMQLHGSQGPEDKKRRKMSRLLSEFCCRSQRVASAGMREAQEECEE